ncbi:hypothetical protein [Nocardioides sp. YIM 152315]|uniref:hypothetical protein n=1 Tax=Nocardioides sp. YIM 152315 TaxID=3031760 RepID=UPI0023DCCBB1|nr:hypothetical protein [Nocardioides sp. YIM 152315]MDF1604446.1 hypothetical protein [Nocardioides sp. YIM 152315]
MPEPDLTREEEDVRRLLAEARHVEPMPDDVVDRLDRVLADLRPARAEPAADRLPDHTAEQRRRWLRNLVLAAAVVVVVGVGISRIDLSGADDDAGSSADSSAEAPAARDQAEAGGDASPDAGAPLALRSATFERQVAHYAGTGRLTKLSQLRSLDADEGKAEDGAPSAARCPGDDRGPGREVAATYDGGPAVLVVRPAADGDRRVDLYLCGTDEPLRSTTVPAP